MTSKGSLFVNNEVVSLGGWLLQGLREDYTKYCVLILVLSKLSILVRFALHVSSGGKGEGRSGPRGYYWTTGCGGRAVGRVEIGCIGGVLG